MSMGSATISQIRKKNGEVIMNALRDIKEPASFKNIVKYVADTQNLDESLIKDQVKLVLSKGVSYGFLQRSGNRYSVDPVDANTEESMDGHSRKAKKSHKRGGKRGKSRRHKSKSRSRSKRRR